MNREKFTSEDVFLQKLIDFIDSSIAFEDRHRSIDFNDGYRRGFVQALRMLRVPVTFRLSEVQNEEISNGH